MTFAEAGAFRMPIGPRAGRTLDDIASTDQGLLYLDWLRGELEHAKHERAALKAALAAYLDDPTIAADVAKLARNHA